jgi:hypothetical protein
MKFIHAIVLTNTQVRNEYYDLGDWDDLNNGDYVVHCLYSVDNEDVVILDDNTHEPVETMIDMFLEGYDYANAINVGGLMMPGEEVAEVIRGYVVVDDGFAYDVNAVTQRFLKGNYGEVK